MSWLKGFELLDPPSSSLLYSRESAFYFPPPPAVFAADDEFAFLDILSPPLSLLQDPFYCSTTAARRISEERDRAEAELALQSLSARVAALEVAFVRATKAKAPAPPTPPAPPAVDRKYKWTTEIKGAEGDLFDRKYRITALAKSGESKTVKWAAEFKGKGKNPPPTRTYTFQTISTPAAPKKKKEEEKEDNKKNISKPAARIVEIEDEPGPGAVAIRKAFASTRSKGKMKVLSKQDAALIIQMRFREHLTHRAKVIHSLRQLAVAKAKLKEIRSLFYNYSYRHLIAEDAAERQNFSQKIVVLLLTVEALEGSDYMVRAAKKSMIEELEAIQAVVDPQSRKSRKFDLPEGGPISKEMSKGVAGVVRVVNEEA